MTVVNCRATDHNGKRGCDPRRSDDIAIISSPNCVVITQFSNPTKASQQGLMRIIQAGYGVGASSVLLPVIPGAYALYSLRCYLSYVAPMTFLPREKYL